MAPKLGDLKNRAIAGAIYILINAVCILIGGWVMVALLCVTAGICAYEFCRMQRDDARIPNVLIGVVFAALYPIVMALFGLQGVAIMMIVSVLLISIWYVFFLPARISDVCVSVFGSLYIGILISCFIPIREALPGIWGGLVVLLIFMSVWFDDAIAYLVGSKIGKHKMAPKISPKKSWEGFIAGLIISIAFWIGVSFVPGVTMSVGLAILFGILCGCASVIGDLVESRMKRNAGVKDSGKIMPGHGGLFDRSDSMFPVAALSLIMMYLGGCLPIVL